LGLLNTSACNGVLDGCLDSAAKFLPGCVATIGRLVQLWIRQCPESGINGTKENKFVVARPEQPNFQSIVVSIGLQVMLMAAGFDTHG
jgi:hypothetical protein